MTENENENTEYNKLENAPEWVDHPKHYNEHPSGIECIDVIEHMSFNIGTCIKYLWRVGLKLDNPVEQELDKAIWYLQREKKRLKI